MNFKISAPMASLQPSAIREILKFTADPNVISLAAGNPAPESFPVDKITHIIDEIMRKNPIEALQYSLSEGYTPLRNTLKEILLKRYGIGRDFDDTIIVTGAQHGIDLTCKVLCNAGDTVICESPSFIGSLNCFRSYGVNLIGVPMEQDGMNIEALETALKQNPNTKFIYTIPNFQNPTGFTTSLEKRKAIINLAKKYDVVILEDNPYGDLRFEGEDIKNIKALDDEGRVVYCGSFSKILSPGLRVGYLTAHRDIIAKLVVAMQCTNVHTNILAQKICYKFLTEYSFDEHIENLREIYKKKANLMMSEIDKHIGDKISYSKAEGGLFISCHLPKDVDMPAFCKKAVSDYKVAVVPGNAFIIDENEPCHFIRLNYSTPTDEQIVKGISLLGKLVNEMF